MTKKTFPLLWNRWVHEGKALEAAGCPRSVPWAFVAEHEEQCKENHDQSVARLAERGGLGINELVYVLRDARWPRPCNNIMSELAALPELMKRLAAWREKNPT